jgi:hypothetical protein
MIKKAVLMVLVGVLIVFSASISFANQTDGMVSGTALVGLPIGIQASINPGGLGDSLLYGYYNVRGAADLFNVVNTSNSQGVKARVVFRNAKNSVECLDFSICLSEGDVWTGLLLDNGTTAALCSLDTDTITDPAIPANCQAFKYSGAGGISGVTADDCREGYFEIIGMTGIPGYDKADRASTGGLNTSAECGSFTSTSDVLNTLMGNNTIIALDLSNTMSYSATAVADTSFIPVPLPAGSELSIPNAMSAGRDAITACDEADYIFTKSALGSPYDVITGWGDTDIIVTFPTRKACHETAVFADLFEGDKVSATATAIDYCTTIGFNFWDDKENLDVAPGDFSPSPQTRPCLPFEVNVIRLGNAVWDSSVVLTQPAPFDLGWTRIDLVSENDAQIPTHVHSTTYGGNTAFGLPAVAYTTQSFTFAPGYMLPTAYDTVVTVAAP